MSDDGSGKTSSALAIAEKRTTHRPGGCVGIFFQLFDWNRRFAKKKLFSRKFLPPVRAKQASKKFKGDEKMPTSKLHLIADENKGGFPNMKRHSARGVADSEHNNYETRAPGLVARLMGLESMPAMREKPKKASFSDPSDNGEKRFVNKVSGSGNVGVDVERGSVKVDSRPQKLQKTGQFERKALTRFGAESAFQIKNVLSRSRKHYHHLHHHHHPKFVSPVKSPRIPSGRNVSRTSRLIDAATKILEPGLQSASKAKCALAYSSSVHYYRSNNVAATERMEIKSEEQTNQVSGYNDDEAKLLMGQTSCKNCGNLLDVVSCRPNVDKGSPVFPSFGSGFVNGCSSEITGRSITRIPVSPFGQEMEPNFQRGWDQPVSLVPQKEETDNVQLNSKPITGRKFLPREGLAPWPSSNQPHRFQINAPPSVNLKQRVQMQDQMPLGRDRTPPRINSKPNHVESRTVPSAANAVRGTKDFVSLNRSLSGRARPRVPTRVESSNKFVPDRKAFNGRDESLPQLRSPVRKRRTINVSGQVESRGFVGSTALNSRNTQCDSMTGKGFGLNAHSMNRSCIKSRLAGPREGDGATKSNSNDVISFTFNSPIRQKPGSSLEMEETTMDDGIKESCQNPSSLKGDSIAALLKQKMKELTCQENDEFVIGSSPKRSTAMILQELISALTLERPDIASASNAETKLEKSAGVFNVADHLSPGSVLEASFSSSSLDDSSGHRLYTDSIDYSSDQVHCSGDQLQYLGLDSDLLDSASSSGKKMTGCERVAALVRNVSRVLNTINLAGGRLTEIGLAHAKEVVVNAELLFGNVKLHNLDGLERLFLGPILLELEAIANIAWTNVNILTGADATKAGNQYRGFLFDCLIECLESRYRKNLNSGFRAWTKLPSLVDREMIIGDVEKEMKKWTSLAGLITDEIIDWEMSHSLGKWTNFDIEAFEIGNEACDDIFQALINESVNDL